MKKSNLKTIGKVILALAVIICVALDCWGLYINKYGESKINNYTFKLSQQTASAYNPTTGEVTEDTRWFAEVNIYDDCYEIKFNYFTDDSRTEFYSQGIQFYLTNESDTLSNALNQNYKKKESVTLNKSTLDNLLAYANYVKQPYQFYYKTNTVTGTSKDALGNNKVIYKDVFVKQNKFLFFNTTKEYNRTYQYYNVLSQKTYNNLEVTNFSSSNNFEDSLISSNPLNSDSIFTVEMYNKTYYIQMRGNDTKYLSNNKEKFLLADYTTAQFRDDFSYVTSTDGKNKYYHYSHNEVFRACDIYYLAELIYNSCSSLNYSSTGIPITFEFGDYFKYYDSEGNEITNTPICNKVQNFITSYWQINVKKHQGKMTSSSQSLFNNFKGSSNYNEAESDSSQSSSEIFTDYHHGRTVLDLNENFFDKIFVENTVQETSPKSYKVYLALKSDFKKIYSDYSSYRLRITINLDNFNYNNLSFEGFVDGTLSNYKIYQIKTTSTATGELVEKDITTEVIANV